MEQDDSIDVVEALLAIHTAIMKIADTLPPQQVLALQDELNTILNICRKLVNRRKEQFPPGLLGSSLISQARNEPR